MEFPLFRARNQQYTRMLMLKPPVRVASRAAKGNGVKNKGMNSTIVKKSRSVTA